MRKMNDLLRAHAKFDVVSGVFSVFSELHVRDGRIDGYVKPLFHDLKVYDKEEDEDKRFGQKVKEKAIDVASTILKNHRAGTSPRRRTSRDRSTARGRARGRSWSGWWRTRSSRPSCPASSGRPPSHAASATSRPPRRRVRPGRPSRPAPAGRGTRSSAAARARSAPTPQSRRRRGRRPWRTS